MEIDNVESPPIDDIDGFLIDVPSEDDMTIDTSYTLEERLRFTALVGGSFALLFALIVNFVNPIRSFIVEICVALLSGS